MTNAAPGSGFLLSLKLTVAVAALLGSCCGGAAVPVKEDTPWWFNSCTSDPSPIRHSRSAKEHRDPVALALHIFVRQLQKNMKSIDKLYKQVDKDRSSFGKLKWLNVKRMLKNMKMEEKRMPEFFRALQHFAGTLDMLHTLEFQTDHNFDKKHRHRIYQNLTFEMRQLLCEVQDQLKSNKSSEEFQKLLVKKSQMKLPKFSKEINLTNVHMLDVNFVEKAKRFFNKAKRFFRKRKPSKGNKKANKNQQVGAKRT